MTPAVDAARAAGVEVGIHPYDHDPSHPSYGLEAAQALGVDPGDVVKTLVVALSDERFGLVVVPVITTVELKAAAVALGAKRAVMATEQQAERVTGYVVGGISPLGTRRPLPTAIDETVMANDLVYCSGGRRGLDISLAPSDLVRLAGAVVAPVAKWD